MSLGPPLSGARASGGSFCQQGGVEPPFTDPSHPVGLCQVGSSTVEVGWGGPGRVVRADLGELGSAQAVEVFLIKVRRDASPDAATPDKVSFLWDILLRRLG